MLCVCVTQARLDFTGFPSLDTSQTKQAASRATNQAELSMEVTIIQEGRRAERSTSNELPLSCLDVIWHSASALS